MIAHGNGTNESEQEPGNERMSKKKAVCVWIDIADAKALCDAAGFLKEGYQPFYKTNQWARAAIALDFILQDLEEMGIDAERQHDGKKLFYNPPDFKITD
jgi:hypothetical protein